MAEFSFPQTLISISGFGGWVEQHVTYWVCFRNKHTKARQTLLWGRGVFCSENMQEKTQQVNSFLLCTSSLTSCFRVFFKSSCTRTDNLLPHNLMLNPTKLDLKCRQIYNIVAGCKQFPQVLRNPSKKVCSTRWESIYDFLLINKQIRQMLQ